MNRILHPESNDLDAMVDQATADFEVDEQDFKLDIISRLEYWGVVEIPAFEGLAYWLKHPKVDLRLLPDQDQLRCRVGDQVKFFSIDEALMLLEDVVTHRFFPDDMVTQLRNIQGYHNLEPGFFRLPGMADLVETALKTPNLRVIEGDTLGEILADRPLHIGIAEDNITVDIVDAFGDYHNFSVQQVLGYIEPMRDKTIVKPSVFSAMKRIRREMWQDDGEKSQTFASTTKFWKGRGGFRKPKHQKNWY